MVQKVYLRGNLKIGPWIGHVGNSSSLHENRLNGMWGWEPDGGGLRSKWEVMKLKQKAYRLIFKGFFLS